MHKILLFNDISGVGNCSMGANLPIFCKMGHSCLPIVTATYSCNTAFGGYVCQNNGNVAKSAQNVLDNCSPTAVYVGFCNDGATLGEVLSSVQAVQSQGRIFTVVDPIMADNGKLYRCFDDSYVAEMRKLLPLADVATPNLTEACLLVGVDYNQLTSQSQGGFLGYCGKVFADFCAKTGCKSAVITGVECGTLVGNVVLEEGAIHYVTNERKNGYFAGTGDVFSSVLTGALLNGESLLVATQVAANFVSKSVQATTEQDGRFGVQFEKTLNLL